MEVLDAKDYSWILLQKGESLYLDANCNHSAFGYTFMIELSAKEREQYAARGREYLDWLAHDIHYTAPIFKESRSIYRGRDVSEKYRDEMMAAVKKWRGQKNHEV